MQGPVGAVPLLNVCPSCRSACPSGWTAWSGNHLSPVSPVYIEHIHARHSLFRAVGWAVRHALLNTIDWSVTPPIRQGETKMRGGER